MTASMKARYGAAIDAPSPSRDCRVLAEFDIRSTAPVGRSKGQPVREITRVAKKWVTVFLGGVEGERVALGEEEQDEEDEAGEELLAGDVPLLLPPQ